MGVADRVRFLGVVPHERMASVYSAADLLVLASEREGWPNVLLEAMACGARVVTTRVSDVAEVVNVPAAGAWIAERSAGCLAQAIRQVLAVPVPREATRRHARSEERRVGKEGVSTCRVRRAREQYKKT